MSDDWKNGTNEDIVTSILQSVQFVDNDAKEGAIVRNELRSLILEVLAAKDNKITVLEAKDLDSRRCMYCGGSVPDTNEAMLEHIFSCEKRPEKTLLNKWVRHLSESEYLHDDCAMCAEIEEALRIYDSVPAEETNGG